MDGRARQRELTSLCPSCRRNLQISSQAFLLARWGLFCLHTVFESGLPSNVGVYPAAGATSVIPIKQSQPPPDHRRHHQAIIIACAAPFKNNFVRGRPPEVRFFLPHLSIHSPPVRRRRWRLVGCFEPLVGFPPQTRCLRERRPRGSASISASSPTRHVTFICILTP